MREVVVRKFTEAEKAEVWDSWQRGEATRTRVLPRAIQRIVTFASSPPPGVAAVVVGATGASTPAGHSKDNPVVSAGSRARPNPGN